ncbi:ThiF family adenylyltransferase [Stenotrophomonas sp. 2MCAF14_2]|uniref:ThiF family adenylyltransferase n=1 Tax=Stenotrophomonas sp. 2MCAF14_2 TaxID=3232983 RepID=UPI003F9C77B1
MTSDFLDWGVSIPEDEADPFRDVRMQALLRACNAHADINVVELRRLEDPFAAEIIVADVGDGTVSPGNDAGIRRIERIALLYRSGARFPFEARPLRKSFPKALHQYSTGDHGPPSLCIIEGDWEMVEHRYTPEALLETLLSWLERTADGTIHEPDRRLEPVFYSLGQCLMLPPDFAEALSDPSKELALMDAWPWERGMTYRTRIVASGSPARAAHRILIMDAAPIAHLPLSSPPSTLGTLEELLAAKGSSLMPGLANSVQEAFRRCSSTNIQPGDGRIILIIRLPRLRDGETVCIDSIGFRFDCDLVTLGLKIQALCRYGDNGSVQPVVILGEDPGWPESGWQDIEVLHIDVSRSLSRDDAQRWSAIEGGEFRGVIAGVGALGSALIDMWSRSAWGHWDYIDPDVLAQHNIVRHVGSQDQVGLPKVEVAKRHARRTLGISDPDVKALQDRASDLDNEPVRACLKRGDLLIDASTTIQVTRAWSGADLPRSMAAFLTPSGDGCVLLAEDSAQEIRGASLEAQYYRAIIQQDWGVAHLEAKGRPLRSGAGCRDVSVVLGYDQVLQSASLLARQIRNRSMLAGASIDVWESSSDGSIRHIEVAARRTFSKTVEDWTILWDEGLCQQLLEARANSLPLETGGILLGVVDFKLNTIHLVDGRSAPKDSVSTEADFQCGSCGVQEDITEAQRRTAGMVLWIGAWHSHPQGVKAVPSIQDQELLSHLCTRLGAHGLPAVMLIAGENGIDVFLQAKGS